MRTLIVSPHLDDAVLSLGQFMLTRPGCVVLTVLAGEPEQVVLTDYDRARGFASSFDAVRARQAEDLVACHRVEAVQALLPFLDRQYGETVHPWAITSAVHDVLRARPGMGWEVFTPLGIGHPDHQLVGDAAREACKAGIDRVFAYEELPYRVLHPEQVPEAFDRIRSLGWIHADLPHPIGAGDRGAKVMAICGYESQFPELDDAVDPCLLVPERAWLVDKVSVE